MRAVFFAWGRALEVSYEIERILEANGLHVTYSHALGWDDQSPALAFEFQSPNLLFNFSPVIVRAEHLAMVSAAINFHTGPPRWPGRGSCSMALLHGDKDFGVTAHLMTPQVDAGPIIAVKRFAIDPSWSCRDLHQATLGHVPSLVSDVVHTMRKNDWRVPKSDGWAWERKAVTKAEFDAAMEIADPSEADTKIRAFAHPEKPGPYVKVSGRKFWYRE